MNATVTDESRAACTPIAELLAWHANETLPPNERRMVEQHIETCASCAALLQLEVRIVECIRKPLDNVEQSPQGSWNQFIARLDLDHVPQQPAPEEQHGKRTRVRWRGARSLIGIALAAQAAAILVLSVLLLRDMALLKEARFRTLSEPDRTIVGGGPMLRVAFESEFRTREVRDWARDHGCHILAGPTLQNVYTLRLDPGRNVEHEMSTMRAHPHVLLVEPISFD
jgi:hypothetical protein